MPSLLRFNFQNDTIMCSCCWASRMLEGRWLLCMFKWIFQTKAEHKARPSFWIDNFHRTGRWYCRVERNEFASLYLSVSLYPTNGMRTRQWCTATMLWKYKFQNRPVWKQAALYENMRPTQTFCSVVILNCAHKAKGAVCVSFAKVGFFWGS